MRLLAILIVASGLAQDAEKIKTALKGVGDRTYKVSGEKGSSGTLVLKTTVDKDGATLDDALEAEIGGRKLAMAFKQGCKLDAFLNPTSVEGKMIEGEQAFAITVAVKDGKAAAKMTAGAETSEKEVELGGKAITHFALFRVVCLLEAKKDATVAFDLFDVPDLKMRKDCSLTCAGKEKTDVAGKSVECDKWTMKRDKRESTLWVSGGVVVKASLDGLDFELVEKK